MLREIEEKEGPLNPESDAGESDAEAAGEGVPDVTGEAAATTEVESPEAKTTDEATDDAAKSDADPAAGRAARAVPLTFAPPRPRAAPAGPRRPPQRTRDPRASMAAKKLKASEKSAILTKIVGKLKKRYGSKVPESERGVLETFIFAACLEDATDEQAEAAYSRLLDQFHDMNEIRVSLISEIERTLDELSEPAIRARRVREGLQHFFEEHFNFDLEPMKKKTQDSAGQELGRRAVRDAVHAELHAQRGARGARRAAGLTPDGVC